MLTDREFLTWLHDRLHYVHGESAHADYMHRLRLMIEKLPETPTSRVYEHMFVTPAVAPAKT